MFKSAQIQIVPLKKYQQPKYLIIFIQIQTLLSEELKKMSIQDPFPLPGGSVLVLHSSFVEIHSVVLVKSCWKKHSNIFVAEYIFKYIYRWHFLRVWYSLKGENAVVKLFIDTNTENKIES